jgi:DNA ligase-1
MKDGAPLPFGALQRRIGRKKLARSVLAEVPVALMVFDALEDGGADVRGEPFEARRARLERLVDAHGSAALRISPIVDAPTFDDLARLRETARERGVEGFMLKRRGSAYGAGRKKGEWWKWKIDPLTVDVVLVYARPGHGKRASLLTDYGFGVWSGGELTTVAQAYSGLDDAEIAELDRWIRAHTKERRGPVRIVEPVHVFELGFEAIRRSRRHGSGVALRFPRILRWRRDKLPKDADTLETLHAMLDAHAFEPPRSKKPKQLGLFD